MYVSRDMNLSPARAARQIRAELTLLRHLREAAIEAPDAWWWPWELAAAVWFRWVVHPAHHVYQYLRFRFFRSPDYWCPRPGDPVIDCFQRECTVARVNIWTGMATVMYRNPHWFAEISWQHCLFPDER